MKKFLAVICVLAVICFVSACSGKQEQELLTYELNVVNESDFSGELSARIFDLNGKVALTAKIDGKTQIKLKQGVYTVQLVGLPETVSYELPVLTPSECTATITLIQSKFDSRRQAYYFSVLGIVTNGGELCEGIQVNVCYEPENEFGFCHMPIESDVQGAVRLNTPSGRYHVSVSGEEIGDTIYEEYFRLTTDKRFFIAELTKGKTFSV